MKRVARVLLATFFATAFVATCCVLSARALDNDRKYVRVADCGDANANLAKDQLPANGCIEEHECVVCDINPQPRGDIVDPFGSGVKLWMPQMHACAGERRIGYCTGTGGVDNCDLDYYYVDGVCGGNIKEYQQQPIGP